MCRTRSKGRKIGLNQKVGRWRLKENWMGAPVVWVHRGTRTVSSEIHQSDGSAVCWAEHTWSSACHSGHGAKNRIGTCRGSVTCKELETKWLSRKGNVGTSFHVQEGKREKEGLFIYWHLCSGSCNLYQNMPVALHYIIVLIIQAVFKKLINNAWISKKKWSISKSFCTVINFKFHFSHELVEMPSYGSENEAWRGG